MEWGTIGILFSIAIGIGGAIKSYGVDSRRLGRNEARLDNIEKGLDRSFAHHGDHFEHSRDLDIHWTTRERDSLSKRLDKQDEQIGEILAHVRILATRNGDK